MGIFGNHITYEEVVEALQRRIDEQFTAGGDYTRLAEVGEAILREHIPKSRQSGDPCPKCADDTFPCEVITDYVAHPD